MIREFVLKSFVFERANQRANLCCRTQVVKYKSDLLCFRSDMLSGATFPMFHTTNHAAVATFARRIVHAFVHTPYIPSGGIDFGSFDAGGRAFVTLTAEKKVVPAEDTLPRKTRCTSTRC
jgi:hypothetical protein